MQNEPELPPYAIESVDNAMQILLLIQQQDAVRVTDCSKALGVASSTAHRLLMTMANRGFVQQGRNTRAYRAGPALMEFAFSPVSVQQMKQTARSVMADLCQLLNETINLTVLQRGGAQFIECVECDRPVRVTSRTGTLLPAHATAAGKVLLSGLEPSERQAFMHKGLLGMTDKTITSMLALSEELEDIARLGYAINRGESLEGLRAVAVGVTNASGHLVAALAVSVPVDRGDISTLRRYVGPLTDAARKIGDAL